MPFKQTNLNRAKLTKNQLRLTKSKMKKKATKQNKGKNQYKQNTLAVNALGTKRKLIKKNQLVILFS